MKPLQTIAILVLVHVIVLGLAGCMNNRTQSMVATCQSLLEDSDHSNDKRFLRDADEQLESLRTPANRLQAARRDIEDRNAMKFKQALEECVWQLKSRQ